MAKINVEYDTETKELMLLIDGKQANAERVCIESYGSGQEKYGYFNAYMKPDKDNGVTYSLSAHGSTIEKSNIVEDWARQALKKS